MNSVRLHVSNVRRARSNRKTPTGLSRPRAILSALIAPAAFLLASASQPALGALVFAPGDSITGGQRNATQQFVVGTTGTAGNTWPGAEAPLNAVNNTTGKYLNFGKTNTGFLINPAFNGFGGSVVTSMQLWTANDTEGRDPATYEIWGTNNPITISTTAGTIYNMSDFTMVASGSLALPAGRNDLGVLTNSQTVGFANTVSYTKYLILFPTIKVATANSMQIGEVQLYGVSPAQVLTWTGSASNVWSVGGPNNWQNPTPAPASYSDGSALTFDNSGANTNISIQNGGTAVTPSSLTFVNSTQNYSFSGDAINSTGTLSLNGAGSVTLNNANSYASGIVVNAGTLAVGAAGSLGTGSLAINNPNTGPAGTDVLVTFNSAQTIGALSGTIATPQSGVNTAKLNLNGALTISQSGNSTFSGVIQGTGGLTKNGNGTLILTGVNTYTGGTTVNAGTLQSSAPGDNPQGALPAGQPVTVNAGGTLFFGTDDGLGYYAGAVSSLTVNGGKVVGGPATHSTLPTLTLNGGTLSASDNGNFSGTAVVNYILDGNVTTVAGPVPSAITASSIRLRNDPNNTGNSAPVIFNIPRGTASVDLAISASIQDLAAGFTKTGSGIMSLSNSSVYTGPTVVNGGTLRLRHPLALSSSTVTLTTGAVLSFSAQNSFSGFTDFTVNGGATLDGSSSTATLTDNFGNESRSVFSNAPVSVASGFTASFTYTPSGNRAADGATFTIQSNSPSAVGTGGGGLGFLNMPNSAALEINLYAAGGAVGTDFGTGGEQPGPYVATTPVLLSGGNPIRFQLVYDPLAQTLSETLTDQISLATYQRTFTGVNYTSALNGSNGFVGFTGATGGQVATQTISNFTFSSPASNFTIANNVTLAGGTTAGLEILPASSGAAGSTTVQGILTLNGGSTVNVTGGATASNLPYSLSAAFVILNGNATVNVANNGTGLGQVTFDSMEDLGANASLTKTGLGTLIYSGSTNYTGATVINAGTLVVNGTLSGSITTVNTGGTLAGTGSLGTLAVTVTSGAVLSPGTTGIGTLSTGPLTLQNGSTFRAEVGLNTNDQAKITGAGTLAGTVTLALTLTADPFDGLVFTILDGTSPLLGYAGGARFAYQGTPLDQGQSFLATTGVFSQQFVIDYTADSGRDVTLTAAIPEPTTTTLLAGAVSLLAFRRRRKA